MKLRELFEAIPSRHTDFYNQHKKWWDPAKYAKLFASYRNQFDVPGKDAFRIYIPLGKNIEVGNIETSISEFLTSNGFEVVDFDSGIVKNQNGKTGRLEVALNNIGTDLAKAYKGDYKTYRINLARKSRNDILSGYKVVISRHPRDVISMSIDRAWSGNSCMNPELYGGEYAEEYLPYDVDKGSLVAYLIKPGDEKRIENPLLRVTIRPYYKRESGSRKGNDIILGVATKCYQALDSDNKPTDSEANSLVGPFLNTVREWVNDVHDSQDLIGEFELESDLYSNESDDKIRVVAGENRQIVKNIVATLKSEGEEAFLEQFEDVNDYLIQQEIVRMLPQYLDYLSMEPGSSFLLSLLDDPQNIIHIMKSNLPLRMSFVDDAMEKPKVWQVLKRYYVDQKKPVNNFYFRMAMIEYDEESIMVQTMAERGDITSGMVPAVVKFNPQYAMILAKNNIPIPADTVRTWIANSTLTSKTISNILTYGNYTDEEIKDLISTIIRYRKYDYLRYYENIPLFLQREILSDKMTNIKYIKNPDPDIFTHALTNVRPSEVLEIDIPYEKVDLAIHAFKQRHDLLAIADRFDGLSDPIYKKIVNALRVYAMSQR